jgi:autophagy-related protein 18
MIPAHDSPLAALAFSPNGTKVATASEKGTVIRVFHVNILKFHIQSVKYNS